MTSRPSVADFHRRLRELIERDHEAWLASRHLVEPQRAEETIRRLKVALAGASLPADIRDKLLRTLAPAETAGFKAISGGSLRSVTGLNPTKAIRGLCLLLGIGGVAQPPAPVSAMSQQAIEQAVRDRDNPFDLLLSADVASLIDFGAGDLTFEEQFVEKYLGPLEEAGRDLVLHAEDRLDPQEEVSTLVRAGQDRLSRLRQNPSSRLKFSFAGNRDMFDLQGAKLLSRYTIAACQSPASPTFAYEPSRIAGPAIERRLKETKGEYRRVKVKGREVLQVRHGQEVLTFPPWKFDVSGPLALLDLLSSSGKLCVMGAVDMEVFWEILSQLLPDERARPRDVFFTADNVTEFFGPVYEKLLQLPTGGKIVLKDLRQDIPRVLGDESDRGKTYGFRYVEVRRGAVFPGIPSGRTAYVFQEMAQEATPWFMTLIPAQ
jgi:hypothetical protein